MAITTDAGYFGEINLMLLEDADIVMALLDGSQVDEGTACEIIFMPQNHPNRKSSGSGLNSAEPERVNELASMHTLALR